MQQLLEILFISLVAGLATGIGGLIVLIRKPGRRTFGFLMGFTGGLMISLSFFELVGEAWRISGFEMATAGFGLGAGFMFLVDYLTPHIRFFEKEGNIVDSSLVRAGSLIAVGISIHNIPEGLAIGAGYMHMPEFGLMIATAILLHNIPEGVATALPLCQGGVCRSKAFKTALLSGLAEPLGAMIAALFLSAYAELIPLSLAFAGGVMFFISLDELIPAAREHGHQHYTSAGMILGAISVLILSGVFGV